MIREISMGLLDTSVIVLYFVLVIGLGFLYSRRASKSLESYFLGGKSMHWLALAMSGSVSNFDITGTMWIVSLLFLLGMRSMWIHWMWGIMMGAFFMAYMGKWVRRSKVMTAAEWMVTRFGTDRGGRVARTAYALMAVITLTSFVGYAFQGIGKFASIYLPLSPNASAILIIGITTLYVILGGLYSVVITQVIQTLILTIAGILIAAIAYVNLTPELIANSVSPDWQSIMPVWRLDALEGTSGAGYQLFGALVIVWVVKGFFLNAGGPAQMYDFQFFLASRNARDASKLGAAWSFFLIVRWAMCAGITLLALTGIANVTDPEQVMPIVLREFLPAGIRGVVLAGLLAAFMSTFSSTINSAASFVVRDFLQPLHKGPVDEHVLVAWSRIATVVLVLVGIAVGFQARSIAHIWNWIMMALGAGVIMPNVLRWYWWRMTGWGYAAGTLGGILLSIVALFIPDAPMYIIFPPIVISSLIASVAVSLATPPVPDTVLISFYRTVRPFGAWGHISRKSGLSREELASPAENPWRTVMNTVLGMAAVTGYYLFPMYLTGHWHATAFAWLGMAITATVILAFTWYPYLPLDEPEN
jgi:solute:Na+ symporter, SSS family